MSTIAEVWKKFPKRTLMAKDTRTTCCLDWLDDAEGQTTKLKEMKSD